LVRVDRSYDSLLHERAAILQQATEIGRLTEAQNGALFAYVVDPTPERQKALEGANEKVGQVVNELTAALHDEESQGIAAQMEDANATFGRLVKKVVDYVGRGQPALARTEALTWAVPATETLTKAADSLEQLEQSAMNGQAQANRSLVTATTRTLIAVSAAAFVLALAVGAAFSRMIVKPMRSLAQTAVRIAGCDLTAADVTVRNRDEIRDAANAFNRMKGNLRGIIGRVGDSSEQVGTTAQALGAHSQRLRESAERIAAVVQQIRAGTDLQAAEVESSVTQMDSMSEAALAIALAAATAQGTSAEALEAAGSGQAAVEATVDQMNVIHGQMRELTIRVSELGGHSRRIGLAVELISQIARQTNLLAINASIEAARAGAGGKGFAVVAEEVRKLSQQTELASAEVSEWAGSLQDETGRVTEATEAGVREVATGIDVVRRAGAAFERTLDAVREAAAQFAAVSEQTGHIVRLTESASAAIRSIDDVASQTAAGTRDVSGEVISQVERMDAIVRVVGELAAMAEELNGLMAQFRL
jgi:methyl-accepting chemotaxis protein